MLKIFNKLILFILLFAALPSFKPIHAQELEVWQIQGAGISSPFQGQQITTKPCVVTAVGNNFFFLQSPSDQSDGDAATSDGIYVASNQAGNRSPGDIVQVRGVVFERDGMTQIGQGDVQVTVVGKEAELPPLIILNQDLPSGTPQTPNELESLEGMRVEFTGLSSGPSDFRSMVPVVARQFRPFREAGIRFPGLPDLPVWDGNPEILWMLPNALGQANNRFITAKTNISATGPIFQSESEYILYPEQYTLGNTLAPRAVRVATEAEITIASLNVRRLLSSNNDFNDQTKKIAKYIVEMLRTPDLIALQEVGDGDALSSLVFQIGQLVPEVSYAFQLLLGRGDIHLAYLINPEVISVSEVSQLGKELRFGNGSIVFDRPPLLLTASLVAQPTVEFNLLNVHLRSLLGIEGSNEDFVRKKRFAQSIELAKIIQNEGADNLLVLGDFNAFPFTDGYVDVVNQISGEASLGAQFPVESIPGLSLTKLAESLPIEEQYSFVFQGSAQLIDHALAGPFDQLDIVEMAFARANADFPDSYAPNETLVQRTSDHDGFVIYLQAKAPLSAKDNSFSKISKIYPNPIAIDQTLYIDAIPGFNGFVELISSDGRVILRKRWGIGDIQLSLLGVPAGLYHLRFSDGLSVTSQNLIVN